MLGSVLQLLNKRSIDISGLGVLINIYSAVFNDGDITVSDAIDFYQWQLASSDVIDEGSFTIRAGDNLNINASISDAVNIELINSSPKSSWQTKMNNFIYSRIPKGETEPKANLFIS